MEVWQMTDEQLGEEILTTWDAVRSGKALDVWFAQQARQEAIHRLMNYAAKFNLKIQGIEPKPLGR